MRGDHTEPDAMFSYVSPAQRVPKDHPLRAIRTMVDEVLRRLWSDFEKLYSHTGRPSIPPARLLRALLLQVLTSDEHFTVDGTLVEAWAGLKSFKRQDGSDGQTPPDDPGNPTVNFYGEKRSNDTHQSTTDPDARLMTKGGQEAKLYFMGHVVMEIFGWLKTVGMARKVRHRGLPRVDWNFTFALAAYNLVRIRNLTASTV